MGWVRPKCSSLHQPKMDWCAHLPPSDGGNSGQAANRRSQVIEAHTATMGHSITSRSVSHKHAHPPQNHCSERAPLEWGGTKSHSAFKNSDRCFYIICHRYILSTLVILYYPNCDMWYSIIRGNFPMNLHIFSFKYLACQQSGFGFILL